MNTFVVYLFVMLSCENLPQWGFSKCYVVTVGVARCSGFSIHCYAVAWWFRVITRASLGVVLRVFRVLTRALLGCSIYQSNHSPNRLSTVGWRGC